MPVTLYPILPGDRLDEFIAAFRAAAAADPFGTWLILPTGRLVRDVLHRLDREGAAVITSRVTTLSGFARTLFEDHATDETLVDETEATLILTHLLARHADRLPLLRGTGGTGTVQDLRSLITQIAYRQVAYPEALGDLQGEKSVEIAWVRDAYLKYLQEHRLVSTALLLLWAERWLLDHSDTSTGTVWIYGAVETLPLEKALVCAIRDRAAMLHYALPTIGGEDGGWLGEADPVPPPADTDLWRRHVADLFSGREWTAGDRVRVATWNDPIAEVRGIAGEVRALIDEGVKPGEITVAFPNLSRGAALAAEVFPDFGVPYAPSKGVPLMHSPRVQALTAMLATPARGYRREDVVALLTSSYIGGPASEIDGERVDALARQANIVDGAGTWDRRLAALADGDEAEITGIRAGLAALFADLAALDGTRTLPEHVAAYLSLLDRWGCGRLPAEGDPDLCAREGRDLAAFCQVLDSLATAAPGVPQRSVTLAGFFSTLNLLLAGARTAPLRNRNAVQVVGVRELQHLSVPYLFIGGLLDGEMPDLSARLPFTNNRESRRLGTRTVGGALREEQASFVAALCAGRHIFLSAPVSNGDRPLLPSVFLDAAGRGAGTWGERGAGYSRLTAATAAGVAFAAGDSAAGTALLPSPLRAGEVAARIAVETRARNGAFATPFDAVFTGDGEICSTLRERFGPAAVYSPTTLETYALCPFRFYLRKVLDLAPLPEIEKDLTALKRGSLVHQIAFRFYTGRNRSGPVTPEDRARICAIAADELDGFTFSSPAWTVEREALLGSEVAGPGVLDEFLAAEEKRSASPFVPAYFEFSFGMPLTDGDADPASITAPIPIDLDGGERLLLQGRIDRVDVAPDGSFLVTDYKTGSTHPGPREIMEGTALQIPLYLCAVKALTGLEGAGGTYYRVRKGETRNQAVLWDTHQKERLKGFSKAKNSEVDGIETAVQATLGKVQDHLHAIRDGYFPPAPQETPCPSYCEFRTVCRCDEWRLASARGE